MYSINNVNNFCSNPQDDNVCLFDKEQNISELVVRKIFSYLDMDDLGRCCFVNKSFKASADEFWKDPTKWEGLTKFFPKLRVIDKKVWEKHVDMKTWGLSFGKQLPWDLRVIIPELKKFSALPIENDAGVTLFQNLPNGLAFNKLVAIAQSLEQGEIKFFESTIYATGNQLGGKAADTNSIIMISNDVLKGTDATTGNKTFDDLETIVKTHECEMPGVLHVLISMVFAYLMDNKRLFGRTVIRCSEAVETGVGIGHPIIGDFDSDGFRITIDRFCKDGDGYGTAALRRF